MGWYDLFSLSYDRQLEHLYAPHRQTLAERWSALRGATVLDLACGTGQSIPLLAEAVGEEGRIVGLDRSRGMLAKARRRVERAGWENVALIQGDAEALDGDLLEQACDRREVDAVLCSLALTAIDAWRSVFEASFALLGLGGRYAILDVYAQRRTFQTRAVELLARANLSRRVWEPLAERASRFERIELEADAKVFGGQLYLALGVR